MKTVWILVCDGAKSRTFEKDGKERSWRLIEESVHAESRSRASQLVSDHSGRRSSEGASVHHNALVPASSPKEVEKGHFVHSLSTMLDQAMRSRRFDRLVLVAPPHILGMLRKKLTPELGKHLLATVGKNLNHLSGEELADELRDVVRIPL